MIVRSGLTSSTTLDVGCVYADQVNPLTPAYDLPSPPPPPPRCNQPRCSKLSHRRRRRRRLLRYSSFLFPISHLASHPWPSSFASAFPPAAPSLPSGYPLFRRNSRPNVEQDLLKPAQPPINPSLWADVNCSGNGEAGRRCWTFFFFYSLLREMVRVWFPLDSQIFCQYRRFYFSKKAVRKDDLLFRVLEKKMLKYQVFGLYVYIYMKGLTVDHYLLFISRFLFPLIIQFPTSIKSFNFHSPVSISSTPDVLQFPG